MRAWLLLLLLPGAHAQFVLDASAPSQLTTLAIDRAAEVDVAWTLSCEDVPSGPPAQGPATLSVATTAPEGTLVQTGPIQTVEAPLCPAQANATGTFRITIGTTPAAPGLERLAVAVELEAVWPTATGTGQDAAEATVPVWVDYMGRVSAKVGATLRQGEPGTTSRFAIDVENRGNAASTIMFEASDGWTVPEPPTLPRGGNVSINVTFAHADSAGWDNRESTGIVTLTPIAASDASLRGDPMVLNLLARTRSDVGVPGLPLPLALAALALAMRARSR